MQAASLFSDACSPAILRSTIAILALICSVLIYEIITQLGPSFWQRKATLYAVVLALYPLYWFFTFLYYTDIASLTAVLAMYLVSLKKNYLFSALACRKANVQLDVADLSIRPDSQLTSDNGVGSSNLQKRRPGNAVDTVNYSTQRAAPLHNLFIRCKRSYSVSPHFEQLMYFGLVSALFITPFQFTLLYTAFWFQTFWKNRLLTLFQLFMALTAGFLSVHFFR